MLRRAESPPGAPGAPGIPVTEGNPRAGELTSGQANDLLFIGRPILGRNVRVAVDVHF